MQTNLWNPDGDDSIEGRRVFGGNTTGFNNFNSVKYKWTEQQYREMIQNFWIPEKVSLVDDKLQYNSTAMSAQDKESFNENLSFLSFLDSLQTINLPNIASHITAPEIKKLFSIQEFQEVIHFQSYQYMYESLVPTEERTRLMYLWRDSPALAKRNEYIASVYQNFVDDPSNENLGETLIANYILEGIYFYNAFNFFYNLQSRDLMLGCAAMIRYIERDEVSHVNIFRNIILSYMEEIPGIINKEMVERLVSEGVRQEVEWSQGTTKNKIIGINNTTIDQYTKHLANGLMEGIGFDPLYEDAHNPYKHLDALRVGSGADIKENFFEGTVTSYTHATAITGWDEV